MLMLTTSHLTASHVHSFHICRSGREPHSCGHVVLDVSFTNHRRGHQLCRLRHPHPAAVHNGIRHRRRRILRHHSQRLVLAAALHICSVVAAALDLRRVRLPHGRRRATLRPPCACCCDMQFRGRVCIRRGIRVPGRVSERLRALWLRVDADVVDPCSS